MRLDRQTSRTGIFSAMLCALLLAPMAGADTVYLALGDRGEASFSDVPQPGAIVVDLEVVPASEAEAAAARERTAAAWALANELAEARRGREAEYAEARAERAWRAREREREQAAREAADRAYGWPGYGFGQRRFFPRHGFPHRPRKAPRDPAVRERQPFEPVFRPRPPATSSGMDEDVPAGSGQPLRAGLPRGAGS